MAEVLGYRHVSLSVTNLHTSTEWYRKTLGFETVAEVDGNGFHRARLRSRGGVALSLTCHEQRPAERFDERRTGIDHVAFDVGGIEDVHEFKRRFERLGVRHSEVRHAPNGTAMITLRDPDDIQLEVFGDAAPRR